MLTQNFSFKVEYIEKNVHLKTTFNRSSMSMFL